MANRGPIFGLSRDCKIKAEKKFDSVQAMDVVMWIQAVLRRTICEDFTALKTETDFSAVLKDGIALCELINVIQPDSIKKINRQRAIFKQMENIELFTKACIQYGMNSLDVFQVPDLYEVKAMYTVFNCLHALGSLAIKNGFAGPKYGVKMSDKTERHFSEQQLAEGRNIIPKQAGTNANQTRAGMTAYGNTRQIVPSDVSTPRLSKESQSVISLQYGTNKLANQSGMTAYGFPRQIISQSSVTEETVRHDRSYSKSDTALDKELDQDISAEDDSAFHEDEIGEQEDELIELPESDF